MASLSYFRDPGQPRKTGTQASGHPVGRATLVGYGPEESRLPNARNGALSSCLLLWVCWLLWLWSLHPPRQEILRESLGGQSVIARYRVRVVLERDERRGVAEARLRGFDRDPKPCELRGVVVTESVEASALEAELAEQGAEVPVRDVVWVKGRSLTGLKQNVSWITLGVSNELVPQVQPELLRDNKLTA